AQTPEAVPERAAELQVRARELERLLRAGGTGGLPRPGELAAGAETVAGASFVGRALELPEMEALKAYARDLRGALPSGAIALILDADEPQLFVTLSDDLVRRGASAAELVRRGAEALGGRGGGRPEMAQARGTRRDGIAAALEAIRAELRAQLSHEGA
ncbi:MAG TPA: DHHA1 domain-containing protein, partial [Candidatus Dormibacteraeota bacterium]|nr:DHHA1 domain-containing protein [Candidatus Dormibacteraeota bacterium]